MDTNINKVACLCYACKGTGKEPKWDNMFELLTDTESPNKVCSICGGSGIIYMEMNYEQVY